MNALILLGPPGSGKGTAAHMLGDRAGLHHVSTGDLFRDAIREGKAIGEAIRPYMEAGGLVPDDLVMAVLKDRVAQEEAGAKVLFDGFPRTVPQAESLARVLDDAGAQLTHVFLLEVDREELVRRMCGRLICSGCGSIFNLHTQPPETAGVCDRCGKRLEQRGDDTEETIRHRQDVYEESTLPLVAYYEGQGLLRRIDAARPQEAVVESLLVWLDQGENGSPAE